MPRTITANLSSALDGDVTEVRALLQIDYSTVLRLYNNWPQDQTVFSQTFDAGGFDLRTYEEDLNGGQRASVVVPFSNTILGAAGYEGVFLNEPADGQRAQLWLYEKTNQSTCQLLDGVLENGSLDAGGLFFTLNLTGKINSRKRTPRARWGSPAWNHVVAAGTIVSWKNQKYKIAKEGIR